MCLLQSQILQICHPPEHTRVVIVVSYMCAAPDIMIATACNFLVLWYTVLRRESVGEWPWLALYVKTDMLICVSEACLDTLYIHFAPSVDRACTLSPERTWEPYQTHSTVRTWDWGCACRGCACRGLRVIKMHVESRLLINHWCGIQVKCKPSRGVLRWKRLQRYTGSTRASSSVCAARSLQQWAHL